MMAGRGDELRRHREAMQLAMRRGIPLSAARFELAKARWAARPSRRPIGARGVSTASDTNGGERDPQPWMMRD